MSTMSNKSLSGWKMLIQYEDTKKIQTEFPQSGMHPTRLPVPRKENPTSALTRTCTHAQAQTYTYTH